MIEPAPAADFIDAQSRLRAIFGVDATFHTQTAATWPAGTPLDPETGRPYDPFLEPEAGGVTQDIVKRVSFVHRPVGASGGDFLEQRPSPLGRVDTGSAALIVAEADFPDVEAAQRVTIGPEAWIIVLWRWDEALRLRRWIAYLEHA